ncbi:MAG TPA: hypothetical protein VM555_00570 [Tahibacter sp.]|nr:hypothetical protein [Tahibacter sp.]
MKSLAALVLLAGLAPLGAAQADTQINHASGFCNAAGSSGTLVRQFQGTLSNSSTTEDLHVLCPLVRVSGQDFTGIVNVQVVDRSRTDGIQCSFYNQRAYGHAWVWSGWSSPTLGSGEDNRKTIVFGSSTSQDKWDGFHHIYCILPPSDSVYGDSVLASYSSGG